jgi:predicted nucleic acid-binding protein
VHPRPRWFVDAALHQRGLDRLFRGDRWRVSLVDAVSFEVMDTEGIVEVLGLDSDFVEHGFRLVP